MMARRATDSPINRRYPALRAPLAGSIRPPGVPGLNRCTQKLSSSPKVLSKSGRFSGRIPPGVYHRATAVIVPPLSAPPDLSPDLSLGPFLDRPAGLSLDPVRLQLRPLWPWRDHTPECGRSATPKATILTRTRDVALCCAEASEGGIMAIVIESGFHLPSGKVIAWRPTA